MTINENFADKEDGHRERGKKLTKKKKFSIITQKKYELY